MRTNKPMIIWLDSNSADSASSFLAKLKDYQSIQTFIDDQSCTTYINNHSEQTIILIVSGSFAKEIVPQIYENSNVSLIFVFCASMASYAEWAMDFCDKLLMFDHQSDLLQRMWLEIEKMLREQAKQCIIQADQCKERAKQLKQTCG